MLPYRSMFISTLFGSRPEVLHVVDDALVRLVRDVQVDVVDGRPADGQHSAELTITRVAKRKTSAPFILMN